ncbi:MAG: phosphatase domain-containing protein [Luteimonas sp.]
MSDTPVRRWPGHVVQHLKDMAIDADEYLEAANRRFDAKFGFNRPRHVAAYRAFADAGGVELFGRVLADAPVGGPKEDDGWWDNLLNTYRRFENDVVAGARIKAQFRNTSAEATTDNDGYYRVRIATDATPDDLLWDNATISLADGSLLTPQPVLQVGAVAKFGVISDIDDTVLQSSITDWKTAAQLTFLHNARTRKPLQGVAKLYQALQTGADGAGRNPIFYVSSSPWNLYDLLEDFLELNAIPHGPIFLRDLGLEEGKFIKTPGHGHKLERARELIQRLPQLRWVLIGDSGQADAELYAEAAREFGDRILAIYIRDVDLEAETARDTYVDGFIEKIAGTGVPMLRVADSVAIAEHARGLGLVADAHIAGITAEVRRDQNRPTLGEAAGDAAKESAKTSIEDAVAPLKK